MFKFRYVPNFIFRYIDINIVKGVGVLARDVLMATIVDACRSAEPAGGLPNGDELIQPNRVRETLRAPKDS